MLTRRDFVRASCGVGAGAVLAGLGLSSSPRDADAAVVVDDAILGTALLVLAGLLGVGLGFKTYTDLQNGVPAAIGNSLRRYVSNGSNQSAIVGMAAQDAQNVLGAVYTEAELQEAFQSGEWIDGFVNSITSTGSDALDWLNARSKDAALAWGALKAWSGMLSPNYVTSYVQGVQMGVVDAPDFMSLVSAPAAMTSSYFPPFEEKTSLSLYYPNSRFPTKVEAFDVSPTFVNSSAEAVGNGLFFYPNNYGGLDWRYSGIRCCYYNDRKSRWDISSAGNDRFYVNATGSNAVFNVTYRGLSYDGANLTSVDPTIDRTVDTPQSIDPANWGFGVPVIGTDSVIADDGLRNTGHLLAPGTLDELLRDGSLTVPWADLVYGGGVGLTDARVRGIEGDVSVPLGYPIPLDVPVTVSVPLEGTGYGTQTMTLEDALATGADTSISRPVPLQATPFYPVNPPGTNSSPPTTFPTIPFESFFPFNMLFSWLHWLGDNVR